MTTYKTDDFGRTTKENTVTRNYRAGKWLPAYETQTLSTYDDNGNVSQTETRSRKEGETEWQTQTVKTDYDEQGQAVREYTPRGVKENAATKYEYDILGRMIQSEIPQKKKDGGIEYQKTTTEYDNTGNVRSKEEQIDGDKKAKTEYTYDKRGNLVMVKNCLKDGKAQYVQYVYDIQGNKVRQFTGMTEPLTLAVSEVENVADDVDIFSYAGKTYQLEISGKDLEYYMQIAEIDKKQKELIHNISNQMKMISHFANQQDYKAVLNISGEINEEMQQDEKTIFCDNAVLNSILNEKKRDAVQHGIDAEFYVEPGIVLNISMTDMIALFGNLLDNAIQAAAETKGKKYVNVFIYMQDVGGFCVVKMVNSFHEVILDKGKFFSTKKDKGIHGIGIRSVNRIAEKYGGYLNCSVKGNEFESLLLLSTKTE